jgi:SAM-dependent methyltransferase
MDMSGVDRDRAAREQMAYDSGEVDQVMTRWHGLFPHVFASPNTLRHEKIFDECTREAVVGKNVLDIGCGPGESSRRLLDLGASSVLGIDISQREVSQAAAHAVPGKLDFVVADVTRELDGVYDAIFGRSILHHLDFRGFLPRIYEENLRPGGAMLFMEPLGSNVMVRVYSRIISGAHTPDEQSLLKGDLAWLNATFPQITVRPVNYVTFPAAVITSLVWRDNAHNGVLRWADRVDERLARRPRLIHHFRQASIVIRKPADLHRSSSV